MRTSFHHQPEAQHPNFPLSTSRQADYPIFGAERSPSTESGAAGATTSGSGAGGKPAMPDTANAIHHAASEPTSELAAGRFLVRTIQ
jgi:hypothetical protein